MCNLKTNGCGDVCCADMLTFKDTPLTTEPNLQNEIHAIFAREKFSDDFDYDLLSMPLRLASRLLESDAAVKYIITMHDGDLYLRQPTSHSQAANGGPSECWKKTDWETIDRLHAADEPYKIARFPKGGSVQVNDKTRKRAKEILQQLSHMIGRFRLTPDRLSNAKTCRLPGFRGSLGPDLQSYPGSPTLIKHYPRSPFQYDMNIQGTMQDTLRRMTDVINGTLRVRRRGRMLYKSKEKLLLLQVELAVTLVHEIGHLIPRGPIGIHIPNVFYGNCPIAENGFDLTNDILGGDLLGCEGSFISHTESERVCAAARENDGLDRINKAAMLEEWPSGLKLNSYQVKDMTVDSITPPEGPLKSATIWRVPLSFIEKLYTEEFWTGEVAEKGADALKAPKVGAWVYTTRNHGRSTIARPCHAIDLDSDVLTTEQRKTMMHVYGLCDEHEWDVEATCAWASKISLRSER